MSGRVLRHIGDVAAYPASVTTSAHVPHLMSFFSIWRIAIHMQAMKKTTR